MPRYQSLEVQKYETRIDQHAKIASQKTPKTIPAGHNAHYDQTPLDCTTGKSGCTTCQYRSKRSLLM